MWIKVFVVIVLAAILLNLFTALFHLVRGGPGHSKRTLKFLILRLVFSIILFVGLYIMAHFGLIQPHGLSQPSAPSDTSAASTTNSAQ